MSLSTILWALLWGGSALIAVLILVLAGFGIFTILAMLDWYNHRQ